MNINEAISLLESYEEDAADILAGMSVHRRFDQDSMSYTFRVHPQSAGVYLEFSDEGDATRFLNACITTSPESAVQEFYEFTK